ncbi:hypothetical protein BJY52DRAFT_1184472 [Lactarius psammicola]|nr:hypothetical protein BJY52DRAFT_1184472 [Lactarius psammicola]
MLSSLLVLGLAAVAPSALATVFITSPTANTAWPAAQQATITWQADGNSPDLKSFGPSFIGLYAGNQQQQTLLQPIASDVDVSAVSSVTWQPNPTVGPNFDSYFIRFTSNNFADPTQAQFKVQAFSAKFTLSGMTGTFNATVQAQISGTTAPGGTSTPVSSGSSTISSSTTTSKPSASSSKSGSTPSSTSSTASNGAGRIVVPSVVGASGVAAIAFAFFL